MTASGSSPGLPRTAALSIVIDFVNQLMLGRLNAGIDVTLTDGAATTTLTDPRLGPNSFIGLMPTTAHAATELATLYVTDRTKGAATLHHANNAQTDRTFRALIIG